MVDVNVFEEFIVILIFEVDVFFPAHFLVLVDLPLPNFESKVFIFLFHFTSALAAVYKHPPNKAINDYKSSSINLQLYNLGLFKNYMDKYKKNFNTLNNLLIKQSDMNFELKQ